MWTDRDLGKNMDEQPYTEIKAKILVSSHNLMQRFYSMHFPNVHVFAQWLLRFVVFILSAHLMRHRVHKKTCLSMMREIFSIFWALYVKLKAKIQVYMSRVADDQNYGWFTTAPHFCWDELTFIFNGTNSELAVDSKHFWNGGLRWNSPLINGSLESISHH